MKKQANTPTPSLAKAIDELWSYLGQNATKLKAFVKKQSEGKTSPSKEMDELKALGRAIHPEIDIRLSTLEGQSGLLIYIPMTRKPYLFLIQKFIQLAQPDKLLRKYHLPIVSPVSMSEKYNLRDMVEEELGTFYFEDVQSCFSPHMPTQMNLYSEKIDLYNPHKFEKCRAAIAMLWGEPLLEIFVEDIRIVDKPMEDMRSLYLHALMHNTSLNEAPHFPHIPFDPFEYPCSYQIDSSNSVRKRGSSNFQPLLEELNLWGLRETGRPQPNLDALRQIGAEVYSLHFHYPQSLEQSRHIASNLLYKLFLNETINQRSYFIGNAIGGEEQDVCILDILTIDAELFLSSLRPILADEGNCHIVLERHQVPLAEKYEILFDPSSLSPREMLERGVAPQELIKGIECLKHKDPEIHIIQAQAYTVLGESDKAIDILERLRDEGYQDPNIDYGLGSAYATKTDFCTDSEVIQYAQRSMEHFERVVSLEDFRTRALTQMAQLCFRFPIDGQDAYDLGRKYLIEAQEDKELFEGYESLFYNFEEALSPRDEEALDKEYQERLGVPSGKQSLREASGHKVDLLYYPSSGRSRKCHLVATRGFSSMLIDQGYYPVKRPNGKRRGNKVRVEFVIAIPEELALESLYEQRSWTYDVVASLLKMRIEEGSNFSMDDLAENIISIEGTKLHPYAGHSAYRLRATPPSVFKVAEHRSPILLPSGEVVIFIGITPMYDEEHNYHLHKLPEESAKLGLFRLSPIYKVGRPNLGLGLEEEAIDFDSLMGHYSGLGTDS